MFFSMTLSITLCPKQLYVLPKTTASIFNCKAIVICYIQVLLIFSFFICIEIHTSSKEQIYHVKNFESIL